MSGSCRRLFVRSLHIQFSLGILIAAFPGLLAAASAPETVPGRVLVKLRVAAPAMTPAAVHDSVAALGLDTGLAPEPVMDLSDLTPAAKMPGERLIWILLHGAKDLDVEGTIARLRLRSDVAAAEPDYIMRLVAAEPRAPNAVARDGPAPAAFTPNDPKLAEQWGLDWIEAPAAWSISQGAASQVIAIIDTGIDLSHPDLTSKLWANSDEFPGDHNLDGCPGRCGNDDDGDALIDEDGKGTQRIIPGTTTLDPSWDATSAADDDENGYIDDIAGWNWVGANATPQDDNGHGTHCAGTAAAATNNGIGIAGTCPLCRIMPLKAFKSDGTAAFSDIVKAIDYARKNGATVISMSFASTATSSALRDAIAAAYPIATLVAAAGNDRASRLDSLCEASGLDYPVAPSYPAHYPNVLGVEANDQNGRIAVFSNCQYSVRAPGTSIESTIPNSSYTAWSGTSMAAPYVAGIAGLLRGYKAGDAAWTAGLIYGQLVQSHGNARLALTLTPVPKLELDSATVLDDCAACDKDGSPDAGERIKIVATLRNVWANATAVAGTLTTTSANATIVTGSASFGAIAPNGTATATFVADVKATAANGAALDFNLAAKPSNGSETFNEPIALRTVNATTKQGPLAASETWTSARLYRVTGNLLVPAGITLTIQPGTHVELSAGKSIDVFGTLVARGSATQRIVFDGAGWGGIVFETGSTSATYSSGVYQSGCAIEYAQFEDCSGTAVVTADDTWIARSIFTGNTASYGVKSSTGTTARIEQNLFTANTFGSGGAGAAIAAQAAGTYIDNTIVGNTGDAILAGGCYTIRSNSIFDNSTYELRASYGSGTTCSFTTNYWGTTDAASIASEVFDFTDSGSVGTATVTPPSSTPSTLAPPVVVDIALDPPSPVGTGRLTMTTTFSRPMAMEYAPSVMFGPAPPYTNPVSIGAHWVGGVDITAVSPGGTSTLPRAFTFVAVPTISAVTPSSGATAGGTSVTITGNHLADATVKFGTTAATVVSSSATSITVTSPAHAAGPVDVVVTTTGGSATATGAFTYGSS